ncbi:hypothetical protein SAMN02799624_05011 [Paenibacillus sp. UNC496MF]|nr:hypothetical protein SAMN02799624_05011 [Paenibacillus sp. UNC496MF]
MVIKDVQGLVNPLHFDDKNTLNKFEFIIGDKNLSHEESLRFIDF